ncbi:hypothetical protein [Acutalibacter sp. 1XD8-33]|uniref:hypothetical protein n=1 Tax=Acutalibacter sp. 1XD8-33 TaxID=2320081 RepID=UPI0011C3850E|nr:hypothetical protein [Acutalibacter sp. 1XD8-33]
MLFLWLIPAPRSKVLQTPGTACGAKEARTIAKLFGVTDRHIQQLTKDGVLPATWGSCGRCGANWPRRLRERTEAVSCRTLAWHFLREDKEPDSL